MNKIPTSLRRTWALGLVLLCAVTGNALATPNRGVQLNDWCAKQPVQAVAPQQSRPYQAAGSACSLCHNTASPSVSDLNARAVAVSSCTGTGTGTTCAATVNPFCVATAPTGSSIATPPAGTTVAQGQSITFTAGGTASSPDGFALSYTWLFSNGLPNASGFQVAVPQTLAGTITTTLQVRNSVGMLATGVTPTRTFTVTPTAANQPPVATITTPAANTTIAQGGTVSFAGSGTDPDNNTPLTYAWSFPGGSPASSTSQNPGLVTYATAGTFTASFTVRDSLGLASATVTRTVTVTPAANQAPVATISTPAANATISRGGTVNFQGSGSDPDNNLPLTYSWSFPGGSPASSTAQNPGLVSYATAGTFTASFTVRDSLGLASTPVTRTITVTSAANLPPVATISLPAANVTIAQGGTVSFQGSGTDPDNNTPLTYAWSFPGGSPASSTAQNPGAVIYAAAGTFTASLLVRDSLGLASTAVTRTVTVNAAANQPPVASIVAPAANVTIARGGTVSYQGSGSDPDNNTPLTFSWTFQGGTPASSTAQNPGLVTYSNSGTFTTRLTVTDSKGLASASVTRTVTVSANSLPVATITAPATNVSVVQGASVNFAGSGTASGENRTPLSYSWSFAGGTPASSTTQNPGAVKFATVGVFTVTFTVSDRRGLASLPVTRTVTVTPPPQPPVASIVTPAANVTINQGQTVSFSGSGSDPDNNLPLTYSWSFPGGTPASSTAQNPGAVKFNTVGTFTVSFTVKDATGLVSPPVTRTITVLVAKPVATIVTPAIDVSILPKGTVNFQGSIEGVFNLPATYRWTFPGGNPATSTVLSPGAVQFAKVGRYTATLVITDSKGSKSAPATRVITVAAPNQPVPTLGQCRIDGNDD